MPGGWRGGYWDDGIEGGGGEEGAYGCDVVDGFCFVSD